MVVTGFRHGNMSNITLTFVIGIYSFSSFVYCIRYYGCADDDDDDDGRRRRHLLLSSTLCYTCRMIGAGRPRHSQILNDPLSVKMNS